MTPILLAVDQGTTSTRAISFGLDGRPRATARVELPQGLPRPGWVEHDPERIWRDVCRTLRDVVEQDGGKPRAIGIANQRETTLLWDRATGEAIHPAIVWQDRRTAPLCAALAADGCAPAVRARTGLVLDPYFSATKLRWLLDNVAGARARAERGELAFGTIDSFLLWRLTGGRVHATDATNASRTLLYDIHARRWDPDLCRLFGVPETVLPEVRGNAGPFGETEPALLGRAVPIGGMAGDQQAAMIGQACLVPGDVKSTYGTGCFALANTGERAIASTHGLLTTVAYALNGRVTFALEGSIFVAGAAVRWLRDGLGVIAEAADTAALAAGLPDNGGVYMVPAFVGLGAPHWDPAARAALTGMTFDTGPAHLARAALEAVAYQTADLLEAMAADGAADPRTVRVDGGMVANDWLCQFLADMLDAEVARPADPETTAAGAALLAGLGTGVWSGLDEIAALWHADRTFRPAMTRAGRDALRQGWQAALARTAST